MLEPQGRGNLSSSLILGSTQATNSTDAAWEVALLVAIVGAVITVLVDRVVAVRASRRAYQSLLASLRSEVEALQTEADSRSSTPDAFAFRAPLPTFAWTAMIGSGLQMRLARDPKLFDALTRLYSSVEVANEMSRIAWESLLVSLQASDDPEVARRFHQIALESLAWPNKTVAADALAARGVL